MITKFDTSNYEGEHNALVGWLDYELTKAFTHKATFDDNCYLDLVSPAGLEFRIFVDCGDFDYFESLTLPTGQVLLFGHDVLRELEYHFDANQFALFKKVVTW